MAWSSVYSVSYSVSLHIHLNDTMPRHLSGLIYKNRGSHGRAVNSYWHIYSGINDRLEEAIVSIESKYGDKLWPELFF